MKWCSLCSDYRGPDDSSKYSIIYEGDKRRIVWEDDEFRILPSIGCLEEGYLLLVPKMHVPCLGALPINALNDCLTSLTHQIMKVVASSYGGCTVFEHGVIDCYCRGGGCVDHAHLHIIPRNIDFMKFLSTTQTIRRLHLAADLCAKYQSRVPYIVFSTPGDEFMVFDAGNAPSQLMRRIVAIELGLPDFWNWRLFPFTENMEKTYLCNRKLFQKLTQNRMCNSIAI